MHWPGLYAELNARKQLKAFLNIYLRKHTANRITYIQLTCICASHQTLLGHKYRVILYASDAKYTSDPVCYHIQVRETAANRVLAGDDVVFDQCTKLLGYTLFHRVS